MLREISGQQLMINESQADFESFGTFLIVPKIIHQIWINENGQTASTVPAKYKDYYESWTKFNQDSLHVLWTNDNLMYSEEFKSIPGHEELIRTYHNFPLFIQKLDMLRLIILYVYGGIYVDMDYICYRNIFASLPSDYNSRDCYIVKSKFLFSESFQNSLIVCKKNSPFILEYLKNICKAHNQLMALPERNVFTSDIINYIFVVDVTGPAMIDKTYVTYDYKETIGTLDTDRYLEGLDGGPKGLRVCQHYHHASWSNTFMIVKHARYIIFLALLILLIIIMIVVRLARKRCR